MRHTKLIAALGAATLLLAVNPSHAAGIVEFDADATVFESPNLGGPVADPANGILPVGGTGISNGSFSLFSDFDLGFQLGLRAIRRFEGQITPVDDVYTVQPGESSPGNALWNWEMHVDFDTYSSPGIGSLQGRASHGIDELVLRIDLNPATATQASDYAIVDILPLILLQTSGAAPHLVQGSSNLGFIDDSGQDPIAFTPAYQTFGFDPNSAGSYHFELEAFNNEGSLGMATMEVVVVPEPATWGMMLTGFALAGLRLGKRQARRGQAA